MSLIKASLALCVFASALACGGSGGGGNGDSQPRSLAAPEASKKVTTSFAALQKVEEKRTGRANSRNLFRSADVDQKEVQVLSDKLDQALNTNDCVFTLPTEEAPTNGSENGMNTGIHDMVFEIKGDKCPMTAFVKVDGNEDPKNIQARFEMGFTVKSADMQKELDMTEGFFGGDLKGLVQDDGAGHVKMNLAGVFSGRGTSLTYGPFSSTSDMAMDFAVSMPQQSNVNNGGEINIAMSIDTSQNSLYTFGKDSTSYGSHVKAGPDGSLEQYFVNGKAVSKEEYSAYVSQINIPGFNLGNNPDQGSQQGPIAASSCELLAFDAAKISESQIQQVMSSQNSTSSLQALASAKVSACGVMEQSLGTVGGKSTTLRLMFMSNTNMAYIDVNGVQKSLTLQPEFEDYVIDTVSGVSLVYSCKPVRTCSR